MTYFRSSRPEAFCKKGVLKNFTKLTGKHLCQSLFIKKEALAQVYSCEFCEISKNIFSSKLQPTTASRETCRALEGLLRVLLVSQHSVLVIACTSRVILILFIVGEYRFSRVMAVILVGCSCLEYNNVFFF